MNLRSFIPKDPALVLNLVLIAAFILLLSWPFMSWPSWVPWSAAHRLPVAEAQRDQAVDDAMVAQTQANTQRDASRSLSDTLTVRIQQEAQVREDINAIQAAPDADARQRAFMRSLCRSDIYASEPDCQPYR